MLRMFMENGINPTVLLPSRYSLDRQKEYYKSLGLRNIKFMYEYAEEGDRDISNAYISEESFIKIEKEEIFELNYEGVEIGLHALSTLIRELHANEINMSSVKFRKLLWKKVQQSIIYCIQLNRVFASVKPDKLLIFEKGYTPNGELLQLGIKNEIDIVQSVIGSQYDKFQFKRYSRKNILAHPVSIDRQTWGDLLKENIGETILDEYLNIHKKNYKTNNWFSRVGTQEGKRFFNSEEITDLLALDRNKKTAVVFSHILWDGSFFYGKDLFEDYSDWLVQTVKAAVLNTDVQWLIKVHPVNIWKLKQENAASEPADYKLIQDKVGDLPDHVKVVTADCPFTTSSLFGVVDYCITVRGTVGMEFACFGIPVLTAGTGRYSGLGFTNDSSSKEEYLQKLSSITQIPRMDSHSVYLAKLHFYSLFHLRPLQWQSFKINEESSLNGGTEASKELSFIHSGKRNLSDMEDFKLISDWILNSSNPDLLGSFKA